MELYSGRHCVDTFGWTRDIGERGGYGLTAMVGEMPKPLHIPAIDEEMGGAFNGRRSRS
jgi:hypothetical protein